MNKKVVVIAEFHPTGLNLLQARDDIDTVIVKDPTPENIARAIVNADAVTVRTATLTKEQLALAPELKIVSRYGVGTDNIDVAYCSQRHIPVAVTVGGNDRTVAEHTFMLIMNLAKDVKRGERAVLQQDWQYRDSRRIHDLYGKKILIMGFGRIGQRVAKYCQAFEMQVIAYDPFLSVSPLPGVELVTDFRQRLPESDFITLHLPLSEATRNILGRRELARCKRGAFFINTARGGLVSEEDLMDAVDKEILAGVGLDVFTREPPEPSIPLFNHDRSFFSLHTAGMSEECTENLSLMTVQRIFDCFDGRLDNKYVFNRDEINRQ